MSTRFYGLTGGIGSGKSTACEIFSGLGVPVLDLDQLGKDIVTLEPDILPQLVQQFGSAILNHDASLNRPALAELAFGDSQSTQALNAIMHPAIYRHEQLWRQQQSSPFAIIEASVLIEAKAYTRMDATIVVMADMEIRKQRVLKRGRQSLSAFEAIIQRQCSDSERAHLADFIIHNNGDLPALNSQIQQLADHLLNLPRALSRIRQ